MSEPHPDKTTKHHADLLASFRTPDLDSLCSTILYAYLRSHTPPQYRLHIPILHLPRDDLALRPEFSTVLDRARLDSSNLATLSELDQLSDLDPADTRWILVDHNKLTGSLGDRFGTRTVGCVDHHVDEGAIPQDTGDEPRILEKPKSCMSLVLRYHAETLRALSSNLASSPKLLAQELVDVALAPILVDTRNAKTPSEELATDHAAVALLGEFRGEPVSDSERDAYFELLITRKVAIEALSLQDNFRKDYKAWTEAGLVLGMSTIPQEPEYLFEKMGVASEAFWKEWREFADQRNLDIACIMMSTPPDHQHSRSQRWILLWARNEKATKAAEAFYDANHGTLALDPAPDNVLDLQGARGEYRRFWIMGQSQHTRKQVGPMIRTAIQESAKL